MTTKGCSFFAKVAKGFIPKTAFDALATSMSRITLRLTKKGIFIRECDTEDIRYSRILWDIQWPRSRFSLYRCTKEHIVTLNAKHLQKQLRNVKKKDALTFFVKKNDESQIGITIQPAGTQSDGPAARTETVYISIQHVESDISLMPDLPNTYVDDTGAERSAYSYPMIIGSTDFQKVKKMSGDLTVKMQKGNYISFYAGDSTVMSAHLEFGELTMDPEPDDEENVEYIGNDEDANEDDGKVEYSTDEESNEEEGDYSTDEESGEEENYPEVYEKIFTMSLFAPLIKLPGLTTQMEFYAPKIEPFPLKVSMHAASGLGDITVFIKDKKQIDFDEQKKVQEGGQSSSKTKRSKS